MSSESAAHVSTGRKRGLLRKLVGFVVSVAILAGGIAVSAMLVSTIDKKDETKSQEEERLSAVEVTRLVASTVEDSLTLVGSVAPWEDVSLCAEVGGRIEWLGVEEGETVKAGQELARIDTASIKAMYDEAAAQAKLAKQELERATQLSKRGVSAARDLDTAVAGQDSSAARVRSLSVQLAKSVMKAPFDGVVDTKFQKESEFIDTGRPLLRLVQLHKTKIEVGVPERDILYFKEGDEVSVMLDAMPEHPLKGVIHRISATGDEITHTFRTEVALDNGEGLIKPGMIGRVKFVRKVYPDTLVAPIFSTFQIEDKRLAAVVEDGIVRLRVIETGIMLGGEIQVTSGLAPGDLLVVKGQYDIRDGERVRVVGADAEGQTL